MVWDPGSRIRDPEKTYSGSLIRVQGSKRHRIPDLEHWPWVCLVCVRKRASPSAIIHHSRYVVDRASVTQDHCSRQACTKQTKFLETRRKMAKT
jgi:hypothetical protein